MLMASWKEMVLANSDILSIWAECAHLSFDAGGEVLLDESRNDLPTQGHEALQGAGRTARLALHTRLGREEGHKWNYL